MAALFNNVLRKLLEDLCTVFPDDAVLKRYLANADTLFRLKPAHAQQTFEQTFGTKATKIQQHDETLFDDYPTLYSIDFRALWSKASAGNKKVIWQYLEQLNLTSKLGSAVPPELLTAAESAAKNLAAKGLVPAGGTSGGPLDAGVIQSVFSEVAKNPEIISSLFTDLLQGPLGRR